MGEVEKVSAASIDESAAKGFILTQVDRAIHTRWEPAKKRAARIGGPDEVHRVTRSFARELGAVGFATGAAAAVPGVGTATVVGTAAAEFGVFLTRATDLILTIGAMHGLTDSSVEERRWWVLTVLAYGNGAAQFSTKLASEAGKGLGLKATRAIPMEVLQQINRAAGRTLVTKYGTKRGVVTLGRAIPFGVGGVIGGSANYIWVRAIARQSDRFFRAIPEIQPGPATA